MRRRRRFKVQLAFAAVIALLFILYGLFQNDPISEIARKPTSLEEEVSDGSFTRRGLLAYNKTHNKSCTPSSVTEFPDDLFSQAQRRDGAIILNLLAAIYVSWAIAIVCDDYFVPCMEIICDMMGLQSDVAGATFMAFGSSAPELFVSVIGVFITHGDIGIGTILGSAVFNVLCVIGVCGIGAGTVLYLAWWPLVRDNGFYLVSIGVLILVLMDDVVTWPEATAMVCSYSIYLVIMYFNSRIEAWLYRIINTRSPEFKSDLHASNDVGTKGGYEKVVNREQGETQTKAKTTDSTDKEPEEKQNQQEEIKEVFGEARPLLGGSDEHRPHEVPDDTLRTRFSPPKRLWGRLCWLLGFPIHLVFFITIPDVKKESCRKCVAVSFVLCIIWIGASSYILVWMVTIIGYTFRISDAVMGLSLVAFGSSVPDCVASLLVAQKGDGNMAVSQTIGSNVFDILLCLGVPWLIKTAAWDSTVAIHSHGLFVSSICIAASVAIAFLVLYVSKWVLNRKVGFIFLTLYLVFLGVSIYVEMLAAQSKPPMCIVGY